jgi:hypothetical protein
LDINGKENKFRIYPILEVIINNNFKIVDILLKYVKKKKNKKIKQNKIGY